METRRTEKHRAFSEGRQGDGQRSGNTIKVKAEKFGTGCSRWMCRILDWYGGYAFRLWEILK